MLAWQRLAPALAGALLFVVYVATVAPTVTLWDAGEFIAAVETLGIPHPPGTPLYVLIARVWSDLLGFLPRALATNLFSAAATATAAAFLAALLARGTRQPLAALAAGLCAGATATVWSNATETEVYAASLALSLAMVLVGERAGRETGARWSVLLAYLFALAIPLHLSALVAAPGAILLASVDETRRVHWGRAVTLAGAGILAAGAGMVSVPLVLVGLIVIVLGVVRARAVGASTVGVIILGLSAVLVLLVRSAHDPALDAGNPETWSALLDVIARRQYAPTGLWPRQAPLWIQVGNLVQYLDWQFAMGLDAAVGPSWLRTPWTALYAAAGLTGSLRHARDDRRSWLALATIFACATLGLVAYMNFKAGASYAWSFVPEADRHEVRERDYFFALGFFVWGAWAGYGAVRLLSRRRLQWLGIAIACLPIVLNWRVANRRREPEASLAYVAARAWLAPLPERAVLVTGGDNDSFPLWYLQLVEGVRPDVAVITAPLLGADWYRGEVATRYGLLPLEAVASRMSQGQRLRTLASLAARNQRPLAVSVFVDSARRAHLSSAWAFDGLTFHARAGSRGVTPDRPRAARVSALIPTGLLERDPLDTPDRAPRFMARTLRCPSVVASALGHRGGADSLDSTCNFR
ncbi:MAG TPA: DUF2723 domain-containing protein [Gemmatimonadaceae bacterium]|nr:DUF2723 domain-containing protein [Gemmatimonadaceae bacterium]